MRSSSRAPGCCPRHAPWSRLGATIQRLVVVIVTTGAWFAPTAAIAQESSSSSSGPTPAEILEDIRRQRLPGEVIPPASASRPDATPRSAPLWPEGWYLVSQSGELVANNGDWALVLADESAPTPRFPLLPNTTLETMVRAVSDQPPPHRYTVSGPVTVFRGANYLLPRVALRINEPAPAAPTPDGAADPVDMVEWMKQQKPPEQVLPRPGATELPGGSFEGSAAMLAEGATVIQRPGRVARDGASWMFISESQSAEKPQPPLKVLPNRAAELMIDAAEREPTGLLFLVSGDVTVFRGENYLLVRNVARRVDTGNLAK